MVSAYVVTQSDQSLTDTLVPRPAATATPLTRFVLEVAIWPGVEPTTELLPVHIHRAL